MNDETSLEPIAPPPSEDTDSRYGDKYVAAELRDRLAAFVIDLTLLAGIGLVAANVMTYLTRPAWNGIPNLRLFHSKLLLGAMGLLAFLYFFILEGAMGATIGKMLCRLKITTKRGEFPSLVAVVLRNLLRPVELVLAPILTLPIMEWTNFRQRPSDCLFGTIVVRRLDESADSTVGDPRYAAATGRFISASLGGTVLVGLIAAILLNISQEGDRWLISVILLNTLPAAIVLYKIILNDLCETDLFGWFFGHKIVSDTGGRVTFSGALLRALVFPIDAIGVGYLAMLLSPRRQRLGDFLGGTAVIRGRAPWYKGMAPLLITLLLTAVLGILGTGNRTNLLKAPVTINWANRWFVTCPDASRVADLKAGLKALIRRI